RLLQTGGLLGAGLALGRLSEAGAQIPPTEVGELVPPPDPPWSAQGVPFTTQGIRSPYLGGLKRALRTGPNTSAVGLTEGSNYAPLQDLDGMITPSDLHFQRNHAGTPIIDPAQHQVIVHGMVDRP